MSQSRRMRRQQEREAGKNPGLDKVSRTPLPPLTDNQLAMLRGEIEKYRQDAYTKGCNDGYGQGYEIGISEGCVQGIKEGYERGWNDAYRKMSLDIINRVVSVALKVVQDDWGKFAFKKKEDRPKAFGEVLSLRFTEYLGEGLDDKEKQDELAQLMKSVGFTHEGLGGEEDAGKS